MLGNGSVLFLLFIGRSHCVENLTRVPSGVNTAGSERSVRGALTHEGPEGELKGLPLTPS